ncbi:MAG: ATP-binding protein [Planctomycetota bacterium]
MSASEEFNRRILIVDDNLKIHEDYRKIFDSVEDDGGFVDIEEAFFGTTISKDKSKIPNFFLEFTTDGEEAVDKLTRATSMGLRFAMAFVDMRMPNNWDGLTTIEHLWAVDPELEIVICTAYSDYKWSEIIERLGFSDQLLLLKKPFDVVEIYQMAIAMTEKWNLKQRDIRNRLQLEQTINPEAQSQLRWARSLAEVSHELRTPLSGVLGFTNVLIDQESRLTSSERNEYLRQIRDCSEHLLNMVEETLDYSAAATGRNKIEVSSFNPQDVVEHVVAVLKTQAVENGTRISYTWATKPVSEVWCDQVKLRQILFNVVGNAIKFTPGGFVEIVLYWSLCEGGGDLKIQVNDTGKGIEKEMLETIFEPFEQANSTIQKEFGGTGLGLAICKQLVEQMGGQILAKSELGQGSTFEFFIKCQDNQKTECRENEILNLNSDTSQFDNSWICGKTILVIDDCETNRTLMQLVLEGEEAEVILAESGVEALGCPDLFEVDLILVDLQMPGIDGVETSKKLREKNFSGVILMLTAMQADAVGQLSNEMSNFDGCLPKPFELAQLRRELERLKVIDTV